MSAFIICSDLCACTEMLWMRLMYVSVESMVRSGVNIVQVVLSGFSVILFCFVQAKTLCRLYVFRGCIRACVCRCHPG